MGKYIRSKFMLSKIAWLCKHHDFTEFRYLVNRANCNIPDENGKYPLYYAIKYHSPHIMAYLIRIHANPLLCNAESDFNLVTLAIKYHAPHLNRLLLSVKNNITYEDKLTYLPYVLIQGRIIVLHIYIQTFQIQSIKGMECIFCRYAKISHYQYCRTHNVCLDLQDVLKYNLIYQKYDTFLYNCNFVQYVEQWDHMYPTPSSLRTTNLLSLCALQGFSKGLQYLIDRGADYEAHVVGDCGETYDLLMLLAYNPHYNGESTKRKIAILNVIDLLLEYLSVDNQNSLGMTALMLACRAGNSDIISKLLDAGANIFLEDIEGCGVSLRGFAPARRISGLMQSCGGETPQNIYEYIYEYRV